MLQSKQYYVIEPKTQNSNYNSPKIYLPSATIHLRRKREEMLPASTHHLHSHATATNRRRKREFYSHETATYLRHIHNFNSHATAITTNRRKREFYSHSTAIATNRRRRKRDNHYSDPQTSGFQPYLLHSSQTFEFLPTFNFSDPFDAPSDKNDGTSDKTDQNPTIPVTEMSDLELKRLGFPVPATTTESVYSMLHTFSGSGSGHDLSSVIDSPYIKFTSRK